MSRLIAGVQPLILTQAGQMPTIPTPSTIMPDDSRFNKELDLMVGQLAYNVVDDEWYYRGYSSIQTLLKASTITVGQVEAWQSDKVYKAGNVFVSFVNPSSPDEQFQNEAIYRCKETTLVGQSPETHPEKWVYQGQNVTVDPTTVIETVTIETASSYNPTKEGGYTEGSIVSYKNESSPDPQFQTLELYLANSDIPQGVSPEDSTEWIFKGQEIVEQITYPTVRVKSSISTMQAIVNNMDGDITIIHTTGEIYEYDSEVTEGIKPNNVLPTEPGRWVLVVPQKVGEAPKDGNQYVRKDGEWEAVEIGHSFEDQSDTALPTRSVVKAGDGIEFEDDAVEGKTVVRVIEDLTDHIDGADEEKHTSNQIDHDGDKLSNIIPQLVNVADIDMSDINVGEKKIIVAEKDAGGNPIFAGGVGLLDVIANPGLSTLLSETNPDWVGDEITLTGNNLNGQLGENSQFFELDADFFLCKAHDNGTTTSDGSATWKRNRGTDSLNPSVPAHVTIINELETESGWNPVAQFKQITAKSKQGSWFRRSTGGYLYMCLDNSNGWTRVGTPPTTDLEITSTSHPVLTASLAAHDFETNRFYVEGTDPNDEPAEQGQEWWDTTNKYVYRRNMDGNWARING